MQGICIDAYLFDSIDEIREVTQTWVDDYNCTRPHDALNGLSPKIYREKTINLLLRYATATPPLTTPNRLNENNYNDKLFYF
ncbi:MAG: transposase [Chitinophagaceae bacterium]|nr:transposase [Chitinophagaceae bacterium]